MENREKPRSAGQNLGAVYLIANVGATWFTPFLRWGQGIKAFAIYGPIGALTMLTYGSMAYCPFIVCRVLPAWLIAVVWRRLRSSPRQHSNYQGHSFLTPWGEAAVLALAGYGFMGISKAMQYFLWISAASIAVVAVLDREARLHRKRLIRDSIAEQEALSYEIERERRTF
jgi:hypothetical protein